MRAVFVSIIIVLLTGCGSIQTGGGPQSKESIFRVRAITVINKNAELIAHGTGFAVNTEKFGMVIVTAAHVLEGNYNRLEFKNKNYEKMDIQYSKVIIMPNDLAMIQVKSGPVHPIRIGTAGLGDKIHSLGFPENKEILRTDGKIVDVRYDAAIKFIVGMSGGPVFNGKNEVVGMISLIKTVGEEEFGVITPLSIIK